MSGVQIPPRLPNSRSRNWSIAGLFVLWDSSAGFAVFSTKTCVVEIDSRHHYSAVLAKVYVELFCRRMVLGYFSRLN